MCVLRSKAANLLAMDGRIRTQAAPAPRAQLMSPRKNPEQWDLPPPLLGECREGQIPISMSCPRCHRTWQIDPATIEGDAAMPIKALAPRFPCECGRRGGPGASPERRPWIQWLRKTGQHKRLPWSAAFVRDEE